MVDILIRDVPEEVVARIDDEAAALGISRTEFLGRWLSSEFANPTKVIDSLRNLAATCADLGDPAVRAAAWRTEPLTPA